ncbi:MAG TPA: cyclic lactone autoinducer peptide [Clostridiaceae bacterium]|nr:cyclic lactone autoinducer peptide [Clostridiaceae bacterium]
MIKGFGLFLAKALAAMAFMAAFLSNFTSCVYWLNQPEMPDKVRMLKQ